VAQPTSASSRSHVSLLNAVPSSSSASTITDFLINLNKTGDPSDPSQSGNRTSNEATPTVFNLTHNVLSAGDVDLLKKGLKFTPSPVVFDKTEHRADSLSVSRKIQLNYSWANRNINVNNKDIDIIKLKSDKAPPKTRDTNLKLLCDQIEHIEPCSRVPPPPKNTTHDMYKSLQNFSRNSAITIKEADKGSGVVLLNSEFYHRKILAMLSDATYITENMDCSTLVKRVLNFAKIFKNMLTKREFDAVTKQVAYLATFNGLPKIHKSETIKQATETQRSVVISCPDPTDLKFRPIVSCQECPTRNLSELLDKLLRPFVGKVKFRLKDTWDFLRKLPDTAPEDTITITADISSLYTNISTAKGKEAISYYINQFPGLLPPRFSEEFVLSTLQFCQDNLYFRYGDNVYRQTTGTGMGRIYAPSLADIKQGFDEVQLEEELRKNLSTEIFNFFVINYGRYLDDIHFRLRRSWLHILPVIQNIMNSIDVSINYEFESSADNLQNSVPFLDVMVSINNGVTETDIYSKCTDTFNYVPFNSAHPRHTIRNIPFCLARRIKGIVSNPDLIQARMETMAARLRARKYPRRLIADAVEKATSTPRESILWPNQSNTTRNSNVNHNKSVYFVTTFDPSKCKPSGQLTGILNTFNNTRDSESEKLKINISFRGSPSLKHMLMFRKSPDQNGVHACIAGCILCREYLHTGQYLTLKTGITLIANAHFDCMSRNLIYIIVCSGCLEFYVGETGDCLKNRFAVHRQQGREDAIIAPVKADQHLRTCGKDKYAVFPFRKPKHNSMIYRRQLEDEWIAKLKPKLNAL